MDDRRTYHEKYDAFYQSRAWRRLRKIKFARETGLCERCRAKGIVRMGEEVHHVVPIEVDWSRRLDPDNLELLCAACHNEQHERESPLQKFSKFWEELENGGAAAEHHAGQEIASEQR